MSVLIKSMEMPKNCKDCPVALSGNYCRINKTHTTFIELPMRPDHCPLVELPEHHGRLIDADKLKNKYSGWYNLATGKSICAVQTKEIDWSPTIIEEGRLI